MDNPRQIRVWPDSLKMHRLQQIPFGRTRGGETDRCSLNRVQSTEALRSTENRIGGLNQPPGREFSYIRLLAEHLKLDKNEVSTSS